MFFKAALDRRWLCSYRNRGLSQGRHSFWGFPKVDGSFVYLLLNFFSCMCLKAKANRVKKKPPVVLIYKMYKNKNFRSHSCVIAVNCFWNTCTDIYCG